MRLIYFFIALLATSIGGIAGIGGGIIIKPCLDTVGSFDVATIGMFSSITVLCMATVSTARFLHSGMKIDVKLAVMLSIGAAVGGVMGKYLFSIFADSVSDNKAKGIQGILLIVLIIFVLFRSVYPGFHIENVWIILLSGLIMGVVSSFLGIGGGPINIAVLCIAFSVSVRDAAVYSIFTIFFSQLTTVISNVITPGIGNYDLSMVVFMIPGAIIGALIGSYLNRKLSDRTVDRLFNVVLVLLIMLNVTNIYRFLF